MLSKNTRIYGIPPYSVAVIHGGPGAGGEMAPVAQELADDFGVLEPLQTQNNLEGQVQELHDQLSQHTTSPLTLVGFSWGAWLSTILAARYPQAVRKLILVGSGPFEARYLSNIQDARLSRLNAQERDEYLAILKLLNDPKAIKKEAAFSRLGQLASKADHYDPIQTQSTEPHLQPSSQGNKFHGVLKEAQNLRATGELLAIAGTIRCPVVALHGDFDPHPISGVQEPLSACLKDFRLITLENCGHKPWSERQARGEFYRILRQELHEA